MKTSHTQCSIPAHYHLLTLSYFAYDKFIVQEYISGFKQFGEIRIYWINEEYSYAVNTKDIGDEYNMIVTPL